MKEKDTTRSIAVINKEISKELADPAIVRGLLATTFKDFDEKLMRQAIFEGVVRGFTLKDFLQRDVYAIKYGGGYSLVTSISFARKIAQKNGVWISGPTYIMDGKKIVTCSVTAYRRIGKDIAEYTAMVYFDEYNTGKNQWSSRPHTMINKVADAHVYRKACPEELSQAYTEEEFDKNKEEVYDTEGIDDDTVPSVHVGDDHGIAAPNLLIDRTSTQSEPEVPQDEESQKNLIHGLVAKRWPAINLKDAKAVKLAIEDETTLAYKAANYPSIINALR